MALLLASTIAASIPAAVDAFMQNAPDDLQNQRIAELERRVARMDEIAESTASCVRISFAMAGADLLSTAAALKWCDGCAEANPAGFSVEARVATKLASLGGEVYECYSRAKAGKDGAGWIALVLRGIQGLAVLNNTVSAIKGAPLFSWGVTSAAVEPGQPPRPSAGIPLIKVRF